jgi:hypothetical protein
MEKAPAVFVIARREATKQSMAPRHTGGHGLLRFAGNDGVILKRQF